MKKKISILFIPVLIIVLLAAFKINSTAILNSGGETYRLGEKSLDKAFGSKIKSGNLSTDYEIDTAIADMSDLRLNTLNIPVVININNLSTSSMEVDEKSEEKAIELIKRVKDSNVNVILEPYPWIQDGEKYETDWNPKDKGEFFVNWERKVLNRLVAEVAVPYKVDALVIASNLEHMERFGDRWINIIRSLRKKYDGLLTYKTSWWYTAKWDVNSMKKYQEKLNNRIFSSVDYISIAAYFEITDKIESSSKELLKYLHRTQIYGRHQDVIGEVRNFHTKWGKPVFFGELGFPNRNYAASRPWDPEVSNTINNREQANCFEAYRKAFKDKWFLGFSVFAIGEHGKDKNYYPREEARSVIREWFQ